MRRPGLLPPGQPGADLELALTTGLWQFWMSHGHFAEGRERLTGTLSRTGDGAAPKVRLKAMNGVAVMAWHRRILTLDDAVASVLAMPPRTEVQG